MRSTPELLGTVGAGAFGALVAALIVGASLLLVLPAVAAVAAVAAFSVGSARSSRRDADEG